MHIFITEQSHQLFSKGLMTVWYQVIDWSNVELFLIIYLGRNLSILFMILVISSLDFLYHSIPYHNWVLKNLSICYGTDFISWSLLS